MKKELTLIKNDETMFFQILGFKNKDDYGEIFITKNNFETTIFRGVGLKKVIEKTKISLK
ncbi:hypothetical protein ACQKFO_09345 [Rossellomorea sp. NPDC071047]|uniref:hypothetical protein n=1 Tax=Rossellomorea sp. NPDC071047 TaxID=3390675 RepID=UPI003D015397